jgi:putative chitinase
MTPDVLVQAGLTDPATAEVVAPPLTAACARFGIDTSARLAGFLSQCAHESSGFRTTEESLNYSAEALLRVFPRYFDGNLAAQYARSPQRIANRVYAGRMGNGLEASGDGWRYRGRGFIQLTGRENYQAFGAAIGQNVLADPDQVSAALLAALSAAWFFSSRGLNLLADAGDVVGMTRRINGGTIGLDDRTKLYDQAAAVLA